MYGDDTRPRPLAAGAERSKLRADGTHADVGVSRSNLDVQVTYRNTVGRMLVTSQWEVCIKSRGGRHGATCFKRCSTRYVSPCTEY